MSSINLNQPSRSLWEDSVYRLKQNKPAMVSLYFIIFLCLVAIFARFIAPYSYETQNMDAILQGPSAKFWFGTDSLGRDQLSRLIYGARMSMAVAIFTAVISLIIGSIYGAISGWFGGIVDRIMMRIVDLLFSIPTLVASSVPLLMTSTVKVRVSPGLPESGVTVLTISRSVD